MAAVSSGAGASAATAADGGAAVVGGRILASPVTRSTPLDRSNLISSPSPFSLSCQWRYKQETASSPDDDGLASAAPPMAAAVVVPSSSLPPATRWGLSRGPAQRQPDNGEMERGGRVAGVDGGGRGAEVVEGEG